MKTVPLGGPTAAGRVALVDDEDYELVMQYRWHVHERPAVGSCRAIGPYARTILYLGGGRKGKRRSIRMHHLIAGHTEVDHRNHNGLDNQRHNLRPATRQENSRNRRARPHSSQYKGVGRRSDSRWGARIWVDGKNRFLGVFADEAEAAMAYDAAARDLFGEFAMTNFP